MSTDRWDQIQELYHAALERQLSERAEFLSQACPNDPELRREVASLLAHEGQADGLLESPAWNHVGPGETATSATLTKAAGSQIGPFRIVELLGVGGMGAVYRATDTRLGRDVALKIIPGTFADDSDRMARFTREARVLASMNHPNIAALYGVEEHALIMELVDGATLTGPMGVEQALPIARQIAEALEYAHEKGVIHRDLKPANIKITPEGKVKVLDFGLAKVFNPPESKGHEVLSTDSVPLTQAWTILGTAAYMSPEQAQGKPVDKRSDIWAFGVVLYEVLTGRNPFRGETFSDTVAAVLTKEPDWDQIPVRARPILRRCLVKDPRKRLRDIGDAMALLDDGPPVEVAVPRRSPVRVAALVVAFVVVFGTGAWWSSLRAPPQILWSGHQLGGPPIAMRPRISPDEQLLAFLAMVNGQTQLAVMKPDSGNWAVLTHERPWSITSICWSRDGARLYFDRYQSAPFGIFSIPVLGGQERLVLENAGNPEVLPDGSLLVARMNVDRRLQLHRFWPETGRIQPLKALITSQVASIAFRVTPSGDQVVFFGTPLDKPSAPNHLYAMKLSSEHTVRLAPEVTLKRTLPFPLAVSADGRSVMFELDSGDLPSIVSVAIDGSADLRTLLTLTKVTSFLDVRRDGSFYADQFQRGAEVVRFSPSGGTVEHLGEVAESPAVLPLPDGRIMFSSRTAGRDLLLVTVPGGKTAPLVETQEETSTPAAVVGLTQIAFLIGRGQNRTIGLASIADGRVTQRLNGPKGAAIDSMAASPDGTTIYYSASGSVWALSASDGQPQKLRSGDSVTVDPYRQELIVRLDEKEGVRLVRVPIAGGPERAIPLEASTYVASASTPLSPSAVNKDGRILVQVSPATSWFWPAAWLDPRTGRTHLLTLGYDADMLSPGWTADGKIVLIAYPFRSSLWHFRGK